MRDLFNRHLLHFSGADLRRIADRIRRNGIEIETRGRGKCHIYVNSKFNGGVVARRTHRGWTFKRFGTVTNGAIAEIHAFVTQPASAVAAAQHPGISSTGVQKPNRRGNLAT